MIYSGIVMRVESDRVIVMCRDFGIISIKPIKKATKGEIAYFSETQIIHRTSPISGYLKGMLRIGAAAAVFIIIVIALLTSTEKGNEIYTAYFNGVSPNKSSKEIVDVENHDAPEKPTVEKPAAEKPEKPGVPAAKPEPKKPEPSKLYEAEKADIHNGMITDRNPGYSGKGFVTNLNKEGDYVEWTVDMPDSGTYKLSFSYVNGKNYNKVMQLIVNNKDIKRVQFPSTDSLRNWSHVDLQVNLNKGQNKIRLISIGKETPDIDYLKVN